MNISFLENFIINENASIQEARKKYDNNRKILIIIDNDNNFKGIVTPKELNNCTVSEENNPVSLITNSNCKTVQYNEDSKILYESLDNIFSNYKNIFYLPVLKGNNIINLFSREGAEHLNKNNRVILKLDNGEKFLYSLLPQIQGLNIIFEGCNNTVIIHETCEFQNSCIHFTNDNNSVTFDRGTNGIFTFALYHKNNTVTIGKNVKSYGFAISLHGDVLKIGDNCLFSNSIRLWTDGHSIIDAKTKDLLNPPKHEIIIGNNVYICENVTLLKRTKIPAHCVIGHSAVVTKPFKDSFCLYAGNPATKHKEGISWVFTPPHDYNKQNETFDF